MYSFADDGRRASASLYETAAQVIPVLFLALALESEAKRRWRRWRRPYRLQTIAALLVGEAAAVALGRKTHGEFRVRSQNVTDLLSSLTVLALAAGFVAVLWATLGQQEWTRWKKSRAASRATDH